MRHAYHLLIATFIIPDVSVDSGDNGYIKPCILKHISLQTLSFGRKLYVMYINKLSAFASQGLKM